MKKILCSFLIIMSFASILLAKRVEIIENANQEIMECTKSDQHSAEMEFALSEYNIKNVRGGSKEFSRINIADEGFFVEEGLPELPRVSRLLAIPNEGSVTLEVTDIESQIIEDVTVFPHQMDESKFKKGEFNLNEEFYSQDRIFPKKVAELSSPAIMRDLRVVNVTLNPFQYNPLKKELSIITNAHISIKFGDAIGENPKSRTERKISRSFESIYESTILNYAQTSRSSEYQLGSYLFIYPNNSTVESYLQVLLDWKQQKGFDVVAASTSETGYTQSGIKNYIQNAYDNWENPPEFICLVGDAGGSFNIPTGSYSGGEGDQYYVRLEGNDILADANIGRLSFESYIEFQTILDKTINYEKNPYVAEPDWFTKALLVGDPTDSGPSCISVSKYIKETIERNDPQFSYDEVYSNPFVSRIANGINSGVSFFSYRGFYGMSGWNNYQTGNLSNGYMLPFVTNPTCGTGSFQGTDDANSEYFLKAGSPGSPKGAIGCIGTATTSTHTCFNNVLSAGIFEGIFDHHIYNMGGALNMGKLALYTSFPANPSGWVWKFSYWNNLMGDPGLELWTDVPQNFNIDFPDEINVGTNYLEVEVLDENNEPVADALVCILEEDDEVFVRDYSDEQGMVYLPVHIISTGDAVLTVTKHNYIPDQQDVEFVQNDGYANIESYSIDDDDIGFSSGNDDGKLNPGEEIELSVDLKNFGFSTLAGVNAELSCPSEWIEITQSQSAYGSISPNSTVSSQDPYIFSVNSDCPGAMEIRFDLVITDDNGSTWTDRIFLNVFSPIFYVDGYEVDDINGILEPNESADIYVTIQNISTVNAENIEAVLVSSHDQLEVQDSIGFFGNIAANGTSTNSGDEFVLAASPEIFPGSQFDLQLKLSNSDGYNSTIHFTFPVGEVEVTDPLGPDSYGYYCYDSGDVQYDLAPEFDWIEIAPDAGGSGTDLNLHDDGDEGDTEVVSLPTNFFFRFYGQLYSNISVCSNGWIAGGITEQTSFMNTPIPGPLGPNPMIAAFWDDLKLENNSQVCYEYDDEAHRFIVEWYNLENDYGYNNEETFQVILYDANYYMTSTGDSPILIQYEEVNNYDVGSYYGSYVQHGEYSTVGLEGLSGLSGLEYTFCNQYPEAALELEDGLALLFTTQGAEIIEPPEVHITPEEFDLEIFPSSSLEEQFAITNSGESNLIYEIEKIYSIFENRNLGRGSGGPDDFGYYWIDSDEDLGTEYNWIDIDGIGSEVTFEDNDEAEGPFNIGFDFEFYGETYTEFIINPNGWIGFDEDFTRWDNTGLPNTLAPHPAIMGLWDDLDPTQGGNVFYHSNAERLVVWFDNVIHYPGQNNGTYDFEMILFPNGEIKFQYRTLSGDLNTNTIGIQNQDASIATLVDFDSFYLSDEFAIEFFQLVNWVSLEPAGGIVSPGNTEIVSLNIDSQELDIGEDYLCNLSVITNDPNSSLVEIPINLSVLSGDYGSVEGVVTLNEGSGNVENVVIEIDDYTTSPNANGAYSLLLEPGIYDITASLDGYEPFSGVVEIIANQTANVDIVLNYLSAPTSIEVNISENYIAQIWWEELSAQRTINPKHPNRNLKENKRDFQSYRLYRKFNEEDWEIIAENLYVNHFQDDLFGAPDGDYRYGVVGVYSGGQSERTESAPIELFRFISVEFSLTLENSQTPEGIILTLTGMDSVYTQTFTDTTSANGEIVLNDVFMADYFLHISKEGYIPIEEEISITEENFQFEYELEIMQGTGNNSSEIPPCYKIGQSYPNPFIVNNDRNSQMTIKYQIPADAEIEIDLYNIKGEKVSTIVKDTKTPGYYDVTWPGSTDNNINLSSGVYFYRMRANNSIVDAKKCLIIK